MKANENSGAFRQGLDHLLPNTPDTISRIDTPSDTDAQRDRITENAESFGNSPPIIRANPEHDDDASEHGGASALAEVPASGSQAYPPLLIGGLLQHNQNKKLYINLTGVGVDYLTVTVPTNTAEIMLARTEQIESGNSGRGFKQSEKRMCMGGDCWRKWEPYTSSKRWGNEYESWEFSGHSAADPYHYLRDQEARPSRIDIAFDYQVPEDYFPKEVEPIIEDHVKSRGATISYYGPSDSHSLYIGSFNSDRMIRIYRRDIKNPLLAAEGMHLLRVELVLKDELARALWQEIKQTGTTGYPEAAAHILDMIGYAPSDDVGDIPELIRTTEDTQAVQMLLQFVTQNSVMLKAIAVCDIDLDSVVDAKIERTKHRMTKNRLAEKVQTLGLVDPVQLVRQVKALIR